MPYILGLTGNIASGKTTVGLMLLELGAVHLRRRRYRRPRTVPAGAAAGRRSRAAFGPNIVDAEGGVDREALGDLVFGDPASLRQLEEIVHPRVQTGADAAAARHPGGGRRRAGRGQAGRVGLCAALPRPLDRHLPAGDTAPRA